MKDSIKYLMIFLEDAREMLSDAAEMAWRLSGADITEGEYGWIQMRVLGQSAQEHYEKIGKLLDSQWLKDAAAEEDKELDELEAKADAASY